MHIVLGNRLWTPDVTVLVHFENYDLYCALDADASAYSKIALCTLQLAC